MQKKAAGIRFTNVNQTAIFCAVPDILIQSVKMTRPQTKRRSGPRRRCLRRPLFCQHSQAAAAAAAGHLASIRPRPPLRPWPIFRAGPFRISVVVIFKSKTRLHQKGLTGARRAWVWKFFSCRIFMRKCQAAREQNTHAHSHTLALIEKIPKSDAKNCNKNRNKRQMTAI